MEFYNIARFPNVIGCIDCTHVKIQSPGGDDAELFRNRKGYMSINVQTVGSISQFINKRCCGTLARFNTCRTFERGEYADSYLLGDSGYPLKMCGSSLNFISVDPSYRRSTHDSVIWNNHPLKSYIERLHNNSGEDLYILYRRFRVSLETNHDDSNLKPRA